MKKNTEQKPVVEIARVHLEKLLDSTAQGIGGAFGVTFIKKDNTVRRMNCRFGVKKGVKGTGHPLGLHTTTRRVYDMTKHEFRSVNLATVTEVRWGGKVYKVVD